MSRRVLIAVPIVVFGAVLAILYRPPSASVASVAAKPVGHWRQIMERIDANRMQAFMDDDVAYLVTSEEWHSPASRTDMEVMTELRERGLRLDRNPVRIDAVSEEFLSLAGDLKRVGLLVTDHLDAHNYVNKDGVIVESRPAREPRTWKIELRRSVGSGRWRLFSAEPARQQSVASTHRGS